MVVKTFKYRLYPTKAQRAVLSQWLGACRYVYNKTLEVRKEAWEKKQETPRLFETNRMLTAWKDDEPWLREIHSQVLQNAQHRVDLAFQGFFRRAKAGLTPGYPRFKGRDRYDSFCFPQYPGGCELVGSALQVRKIGTIRLNLHRPVAGTIKTTTIKTTATGKWFVCFAAEVENADPLPVTGKVIGLDLGLESFATASNGKVIPNPRFFRQRERELARAQRLLSAAKKGTHDRARRRKAVAIIHEKIRNQRANFAHKISRALLRRYDTICLEDLNITGMLRKGSRGLSKSIADAAWTQLVRNLLCKAEEAGREIVLVDPAYTSQTCSRCGHRAKKDLSERLHICKRCGLKLSRDHNAAINILRLGLQSQTSRSKSPKPRLGK